MGFRLAFLILVAGCASPAAAPSPAPERSPERLPEVAVVDLAQRPTTLPLLTRGRPALVALWATWCKSCSHELGELDRLHGRVQDRALVVGVAVGEPYQSVVEYLKPLRLAYPQLVDEEFRLADALGSGRVPTTLVVDRQGVVRYAGGGLDRAALDALRDAMTR